MSYIFLIKFFTRFYIWEKIMKILEFYLIEFPVTGLRLYLRFY